MMRMATLESEVMMSAISRYTEEQNATMRQGQARAFQQHIARTVEAAFAESQTVRADTMEAASRTRSMFDQRSEEHTSELQSLMRISYAVFCLQKKNHT